ncbi:MAG: HAD-IA family hydrolase, partial [Pseudomonadota bacterium]
CTGLTCALQFARKELHLGKLECTGLDGFFGGSVYSGDVVENGKPAPDLFLHSAKQMGGHDPVRCIVVEDSVNGVLGGKAAGMFTIGFMGGAHAIGNHAQSLKNAGADWIADDHARLRSWLTANTNAIAA